MSDTKCPNCGASAWYRAGDGTKNYDCGSSSLSSNPSELCQTRRERDEAIKQNAKLRDIAEAAIDWLKIGNADDKRAAGHIRAELEQIKEGK